MGRLDVNAPIADFLEAIRRITTVRGTVDHVAPEQRWR
jgi:hypothetical protein